MRIPKYVQELLSRSKYDFTLTKNPNYSTGYTIRIYKHSYHAQISTLKNEVERLVKWANRTGGVDTAFLLYIPEKTRYYDQAAVVTIFDPVMQKIEHLIPTS